MHRMYFLLKIIVTLLIVVNVSCQSSKHQKGVDRLETYNSMKELAPRIYNYRNQYGVKDKISTSEDIKRLLGKSNIFDIEDLIFNDQWGNFFSIKEVGDRIIIWSFGPDGINNYGLEDDIKLEW